MAGGLLMALGLSGLYLGQAEQSGLAGLIGFVSLYAATAVSHLSAHTIEATTMPDMPATMRLWGSFVGQALFVSAMLTWLTIVPGGVHSPWTGGNLMLAAVLRLAARFVPMSERLGRQRDLGRRQRRHAWARSDDDLALAVCRGKHFLSQ